MIREKNAQLSEYASQGYEYTPLNDELPKYITKRMLSDLKIYDITQNLSYSSIYGDYATATDAIKLHDLDNDFFNDVVISNYLSGLDYFSPTIRAYLKENTVDHFISLYGKEVTAKILNTSAEEGHALNAEIAYSEEKLNEYISYLTELGINLIDLGDIIDEETGWES